MAWQNEGDILPNRVEVVIDPAPMEVDKNEEPPTSSAPTGSIGLTFSPSPTPATPMGTPTMSASEPSMGDASQAVLKNINQNHENAGPIAAPLNQKGARKRHTHEFHMLYFWHFRHIPGTPAFVIQGFF